MHGPCMRLKVPWGAVAWDKRVRGSWGQAHVDGGGPCTPPAVPRKTCPCLPEHKCEPNSFLPMWARYGLIRFPTAGLPRERLCVWVPPFYAQEAQTFQLAEFQSTALPNEQPHKGKDLCDCTLCFYCCFLFLYFPPCLSNGLSWSSFLFSIYFEIPSYLSLVREKMRLWNCAWILKIGFTGYSFA